MKGASSSDVTRQSRLRVLMLAYFYPPMGGAGVQRSLKFSRYLPEYGILPSVVCADSEEYPHDFALMSEIPAGVDVTRIQHTPMVSRVMSLRRRWRRSTHQDAASLRSSTGPPSRMGSHWRDRVLSASAAVQFPDDKASWSRAAVRTSMRTLSLTPVDIVFSSSPPVSAHAAAMRIARDSGLPWVADFRDLWTDNPAYAAPSWRRGIDERLERRLLAAADGIVGVTESFTSVLNRISGARVPAITIPNGYDEEDFVGLAPAAIEPGVVRFVHTGTFYGQRSPEPFLLGAQRVLERHDSLRSRLRVRFLGSIGTRFDPLLDWFSQRFPGVLERPGYVDHSRALAEMLGATALLLIVDSDDELSLPGKVFEYLRAGRPILVVGPPDGETARLIRDCAAGEVVDARDHEQVAATLDRWIFEGEMPTPDPSIARRFERRNLSRELADFLVDTHRRYQLRGRESVSSR